MNFLTRRERKEKGQNYHSSFYGKSRLAVEKRERSVPLLDFFWLQPSFLTFYDSVHSEEEERERPKAAFFQRKSEEVAARARANCHAVPVTLAFKVTRNYYYV